MYSGATKVDPTEVIFRRTRSGGKEYGCGKKVFEEGREEPKRSGGLVYVVVRG